MSLQLNGENILFKGKVIGKMKGDGTNTRVDLTLKYTAPADDAIIPLSRLAEGLATIFDRRPSGPQAVVITTEDDVEWKSNAIRMLTERTVTSDGHKWVFHKNDPDHWPSDFHGHDYENHLKLDLISGEIYDVGTRRRCGKLRRKSLRVVRDALRKSKDFKTRVDALTKAKTKS